MTYIYNILNGHLNVNEANNDIMYPGSTDL